MISKLPNFDRNIHFRELDPRKDGAEYKFALNRKIKFIFKKNLVDSSKSYYFLDTKGRCWMRILNNSVIINKDYAWNGCSPKKWFGIWWGSPDFEKTIVASLIHDCLLQFHKTQHFPLTRKEVDHTFKEALKLKRFKFRGLFYFGVRMASKLFPRHKYDAYSSLTCDSWE